MHGGIIIISGRALIVVVVVLIFGAVLLTLWMQSLLAVVDCNQSMRRRN
jgi:archaellum component FlaF (FlaF/FlaG flagellin family)